MASQSRKKLPNGEYCPQCCWVTGQYRSALNPNRDATHAKLPIKANLNTEECLVWDQTGKFPYALEIVSKVHQTQDVGVILKASMDVVQWLYDYPKSPLTEEKKAKISKPRLLISSSYKRKYQGKEHVHGFVVVDQNEKDKEMFNLLFGCTNGLKRSAKEPVWIVGAPYKGDWVMVINDEEDIKDIFSSDNIQRTLSKICRKNIKNDTSFYLFVDFVYPACVSITLSLDMKEFESLSNYSNK